MQSHAPEALLTLQKDNATRMGGDRVLLLQAIENCGSISGAARLVGLSYKAAWDGVNAMNNLFRTPLVTGQSGGKKGGGASLTPAGRQVLDAFNLVQSELGQFMGKLQSSLGSPSGELTPELFRSLLMKTSARNTFRCTVSSIEVCGKNARVQLNLTQHQQLSAIITRTSARELELDTDSTCIALIKASFVTLANTRPAAALPDTNLLNGTVLSCDTEDESSETTINLGEGKTLVAVKSASTSATDRPDPGDEVFALVRAGDIILAVQ